MARRATPGRPRYCISRRRRRRPRARDKERRGTSPAPLRHDAAARPGEGAARRAALLRQFHPAPPPVPPRMIKNPARTRIYLASRSPRRRELLKQIGVSFEVLVLREQPARGPDVDESHLPGELPDDYVRRVCRAKADVGWDRVVQRRLRRFPVLAADTVVCVDEKILGKPADPADAARMLRLLSGREHRVLTAVAIR